MAVRPKRVALAAFALVLPLALGGWSPAPAGGAVPGSAAALRPDRSIAGSYRRAKPSRGDLRISAAEGGWRIELRTGGIPRGAGTAADCAMVAVGARVGDRIVGTLVPFELDDVPITADDLGQGGHLIVALRSGEAEVVQADGERLCALGSDFYGRYKRVRDRPVSGIRLPGGTRQ